MNTKDDLPVSLEVWLGQKIEPLGFVLTDVRPDFYDEYALWSKGDEVHVQAIKTDQEWTFLVGTKLGHQIRMTGRYDIYSSLIRCVVSTVKHLTKEPEDS